jgi:hypothetical protein
VGARCSGIVLPGLCAPLTLFGHWDPLFLQAQETDWPTGKTEVHEDHRDFFVGDMPIQGVVGDPVVWLFGSFT